MSPIFRTLRDCLDLLTRRDRLVLGLVTAVQMLMALLDLAGVLLIGVVTGAVLSQSSGSTAPVYVERMQSTVGLGEWSPQSFIALLAVVAAVLLMTKSALSVYLTRRTLRFLANRQAAISARLVSSLMSQPLVVVQKRSTQETAYALLNGVSAATLFALGQGVVALTESALLVTLAVGLFLINPGLTLGAIAYFSVVAVLLHFAISGWADRLGRKIGRAEIDSYRTIQDAMNAYREITVYNLRQEYASRFERLRWQAASVASDVQFIGLAPKYIFEIALVIGAGGLALSQLGSQDAIASLSLVAVFLAAGTRIVPSLLRLQGAAASVRTAAGQAAPTLELAEELAFHRASRTVDPDRRGDLGAVRDAFTPVIELRDVSLTYPGMHEPALKRITMTVQAGTTVALVGPSGAGKSTIADTILGVLSPQHGSVSVSGVSPAEAVDRWPGQIAYVPQRVHLFDESIRGNVVLGRSVQGGQDSAVKQALARADLLDLIEGSDDGLEQIIGEGGLKLSGGQKQRLGIARALYSEPSLIILDEATSALDPRTEANVVGQLQDVGAHATVMVIAHRLSTVQAADVVYYVDGGRVVAAGTFEELRRSHPNFAQLARLSGL